MSKGLKYTVQNQIYLMVCMSKELKVPCTNSNNSNTFNCMHVERVESTVHKSIPVNLMILSLNLMKDTHWNWHCSCSLLYQQPDAI